MLMTGLTKGASYKTHMIHRQHSAAMLMSNYVSAFISRICIMDSGLFLVHAAREKAMLSKHIHLCTDGQRCKEHSGPSLRGIFITLIINHQNHWKVRLNQIVDESLVIRGDENVWVQIYQRFFVNLSLLYHKTWLCNERCACRWLGTSTLNMHVYNRMYRPLFFPHGSITQLSRRRCKQNGAVLCAL